MDYNELILQLKDTAKLQIGMWHKENEEIIEKAITAITDLLSRAEAAEVRANDAERALLGMVANYFRVNEVAKKVLNYARDDDTPSDMKDDIREAAIMLFGIDEAQRRAENATERAEKLEAENAMLRKMQTVRLDADGAQALYLSAMVSELRAELNAKDTDRKGEQD